MNFFDSIRTAFGPFKQSQVDGFNVLLKATEGLSRQHRAYILATAWHEAARTMQPIVERGSRTYFNMYEPPSKKATALGNTLKGDGYNFRGRGYVQITGRANYHKASGVVGIDLVSAPDRTLEPEIAATIIVSGMTRGWFTGKKMSDYSNYRDMRRVVNGLDKADLIAGYAHKFEVALGLISDETISLLNDMARILRETTHWLGAGQQMDLSHQANAVLERYDAWKAKS